MKPNKPIGLDIVLVGGGHSHVEVLRQFAMNPSPGVRLTMISREIDTPYSGMLPGYLSGHYRFDECHIDLGPLCTAAGARLYHSEVTGFDLETKQVVCDNRPNVVFDYLSIDIGSTPSLQGIKGAANAIAIKPVKHFLLRWSTVEKTLLNLKRTPELVVVGGGAGGVEVSLCLAHRLRSMRSVGNGFPKGVNITLVNDGPELLETHSHAVRTRLRQALQKQAIEVVLGCSVDRIDADHVYGDGGFSVASDATVMVTGAASPSWLQSTELDLDERGFVQVDERLRSTSHACVFASGDIASFARPLVKNGVYAVRQGPVLAQSLKALAAGRPPKTFRPQRHTLALISTGEKYAIASYGPLALQGHWVWRIKDWIDRRWMQKYQRLSMPPMDDAEDPMRCGGCGAKVPADVLSEVLNDFRQPDNEHVLIGLASPDDAAVTKPPEGTVTVQSVDQFRHFIDDPYVFALIASNHALSDIYAMGAKPSTAMAMVTLPYAQADKMADDLRQVLAGAQTALEMAGVSLVGGHTSEGAELSFGLSVTGFAKEHELLHKSGLHPGDRLILTKPLGTGTLLAAAMQSRCRYQWLAQALQHMQRSNRSAAEIFVRNNAHACTDVTGFGLLGHLGEMVQASEVHVTVDLMSVPAMDGAIDLLADGITSTLHPGNRLSANEVVTDVGVLSQADLLLDPQTSGGLLAGVSCDQVDETLQALRAAGHSYAKVIGVVCDGPPGRITIETKRQ